MKAMRRLCRVAACAAICTWQASAALAADAIAAGSITNSPPMISYAEDGTTLQGVIVDLAAAMSAKMGREIAFKAIPFAGLLPAMEARRIDIAFTLMNDTPKNFGCSVQHNIAAMVADPRDLLGPGPMGPVDTARRATVMDHYEKGEVTQADKRSVDKSTEQSAGASSIGQ